MRKLFFILWIFIPLLSFQNFSQAQEIQQPMQSTELSLFEEIPMVITPGKKLQPITESPASVYIITADDIRQSGAIHLWDVLRQVPGMDVVNSNIGQADVSMRGFADLLTNKTLLLIDGRSVYLPLQGTLIWEMIPIQLEEIERIEIVKGPVASLYGANANLGLINIITKTPKQIQGGRLVTSGGTTDAKRFSLMYGAQDSRNENLAYKLSTGWKDTNSFNNERDKDALDGVQGNMQVDYVLGDNAKTSVSSGIAQNDSYIYLSSNNIGSQWYFGPISQTMTYVKADYQAGQLSSRVYWNNYHTDLSTKKFRMVGTVDTADLEMRYNFDLAENNSFIVGGGTHYDHVDATLFTDSDDNEHTQGSMNVFLQDEFKFSDTITFNASGRLDHYKLTGVNPSGRLAAMYQPDKLNLYRISAAYSFRNPTLSDLYANLPIDVLGNGFLIATAQGNKQLDPEHYLTYELDWQGTRMDGRLRLFSDVFWTRITDIIDANLTGVGLNSSFINQGDADSSGGEFGAEYDLNSWITVIGNYALNHVEYNNTIEKHFNPKHKINSGLKFKFLDDQLNVKLTSHYVSATETSNGDDGKVQAYHYGNLWVGYKLCSSTEFSITGQNIFYDKHQEIPGGDDIGTRYLAKLDIKF